MRSSQVALRLEQLRNITHVGLIAPVCHLEGLPSAAQQDVGTFQVLHFGTQRLVTFPDFQHDLLFNVRQFGLQPYLILTLYQCTYQPLLCIAFFRK